MWPKMLGHAAHIMLHALLAPGSGRTWGDWVLVEVECRCYCFGVSQGNFLEGAENSTCYRDAQGGSREAFCGKASDMFSSGT